MLNLPTIVFFPNVPHVLTCKPFVYNNNRDESLTGRLVLFARNGTILDSFLFLSHAHSWLTYYTMLPTVRQRLHQTFFFPLYVLQCISQPICTWQHKVKNALRFDFRQTIDIAI